MKHFLLISFLFYQGISVPECKCISERTNSLRMCIVLIPAAAYSWIDLLLNTGANGICPE